MRLLTIAGCSLLLAMSLPTVCASESVEVIPVLKSAPIVQIKTTVGKEPRAAVSVEFFRYESGLREEQRPRLSLLSDIRGIIHPPMLSPGRYHLVAISAEKTETLRADLILDVSEQETANTFAMELIPTRYRSREQFIAAAEQSPNRERIKEFRGTVYDPSGAVIPGVAIEVVRRGATGKDRVAQLKSGAGGEFSTELPKGSYIAVFSASGFKVQLVPFEVSRDGSEALKVTLRLGDSS